MDLERLGQPAIGQVKLGIYRRHDVELEELPPLVFSHGPGVEPNTGWVALWPTDIFDGLGVPLWRDDPGVLDAIFSAVNGEGPQWISPGFAFTLPESPMVLRSLSGEVVEGLLCASTSEAGAWLMLSTEDLGSLLNASPAASYSDLHDEIGVTALLALVEWARCFPLAT